MDISAEIAAIQAASEGSELRQPLVGALNKLNSGALPAVTSSDVGKILKVGANGWEVGEKSGYMPVPSATKQITENGTYNVTDYSSAEVNVSGGSSPTLITKNVTQNGTYNASSDNADGYSEVIVNVSGSASPFEEYDLTDSFVGTIKGIEATGQNVTISSSGAEFAANSVLLIPIWFPWGKIIQIEIETGNLQLTSGGSHKRFVMIGTINNSGNGFIYRNTGKWAFYNGSWVDSQETDGSYFDNCTVKIIIDADGYWHIYKNNVLFWEPNLVLKDQNNLIIGTAAGGIIGTIKKITINAP